MYQTDIYRIVYLTTAEYKFFSSTHATFSTTDHMLGHKTSLSNSRRLKAYQTSSLTTME